MSTPSEPGDRQTVLIPPELHVQFAALAKANGHTGAFLAWCWLRDGVLDARAGRPLPTVAREPAVPGRRKWWPQLRWRQSDTEFAAWRADLEAAGSSPTAVIRARMARYVEAGGDPLAPAGGDTPAADPGPRAPCYI